MGPLARQARLQVAQLRDFDLELAGECARALREDIENQLAAVDDAELEFIFEVARLRGAERVVEDGERRVAFAREFAHFGGLAAADEGTRVDVLESLLNLAGNRCAGALGECAKLVERVFAGNAVGRSQLDADQDGAFGVVRISSRN
jgi:hypothetical protein